MSELTRKRRRRWLAAFLGPAVALSLVVGAAVGCRPGQRTPVRVFFAGSLLRPFTELEAVYEAAHPGVDLLMEGHGSIQCVRHVTDIHDDIDVVVTADHRLIPLLMFSTTDPDTGEPYATWYAEFATNRVALAYTEGSKYADDVSPENWYEVLMRPDVRLGISDPRFDAAGYRVFMILQLSERLYGEPFLMDDLLVGQFEYPVVSHRISDAWEIHVPEIMATRSNARILMRGSSVQLISLLESGEIDYAFEYESVSRQHGFRTVDLPDEIDLGEEGLTEAYGDVTVRLDFRRFRSVEPVFVGETIGYGITIPANARQPEAATEFIAWLLGPEGKAFMTGYHHPMLNPARLYGSENAPHAIAELAVPWPPTGGS